MNLENIRKVRDAIAKLEKEPERFNMASWVGYVDYHLFLESSSEFDSIEEEYQCTLNSIKEGDCNTCACIGGWAVAILSKEYNPQSTFMEEGAELLGLTEEEAHKLFTPWDMYDTPLLGDPVKAGPKEAVKVLTHILENNEIDWNAAWR